MAYVRSFTFSLNASVRGYRVYRANWNPKPDEPLVCNIENDNDFDPYTKACKSEKGVLKTVGHLPREISHPTKFLLLRGADVTVKLGGTAYRHSPLIQGGLEIPCLVTVVLTGNIHGNVLMKRYEEMVTELYSEPEKEI